MIMKQNIFMLMAMRVIKNQKIYEGVNAKECEICKKI